MTHLRVPSPSPYAAEIGFSAAVRAGDWVIAAGTTAVAADGTVVGEGDPHAQAAEALRKALAALASAGAEPRHVVQTRMLLAVREHWRDVGRAHAEALGAVRPAATMVVCMLLDPRMLVEVELVAHLG